MSARVPSRYTRESPPAVEGISGACSCGRGSSLLDDVCHRRVFCERLPAVVAPYGRQTLRLQEALGLIGLALGGRPARGSPLLSDDTSAETLLRRVLHVLAD